MAFRKYNITERAKHLRKTKPTAYLLLSQIAENALFEDRDTVPFKAGFAFVGEFEDCGLTRKKYRNALEYLVENGFIEIICQKHVMNEKKRANDKNDEIPSPTEPPGYNQNRANDKSTKIPLGDAFYTYTRSGILWGHENNQIGAIKRATKGTLVNIIDNSVWDVISADQKEKDHQKGHQKGHHHEQKRANEGPTRGHIQEEKEREKEDLYKEEKRKEVETPSAFFSLSCDKQDFAFFEPENFILPDGKFLSIPMRKSLASRRGTARQQMYANMAVFLDDCKKPSFRLKAGVSYEICLQGYLNKDIATKRQRTITNSIYAKYLIEEKGMRDIKVLKTVVQFGKDRNESISLELPEPEFTEIFEQKINHYQRK